MHYYGSNQNRIQVIPLAYNKDIYSNAIDSSEDVETILRKYSITKPFILSVGRLEEKKNTPRMIEVFNTIKKVIDFELVLIGSPGVGYDQVKEKIKMSPFKTDIKELGYVRPLM